MKDKFSELSQKIITHGLVLYRSNTLTEELNDVIRRQKIVKQLIMPVAEYIEFYKQATTLFNPITLFNVCQDPKDNYLFDLAIQSGAHYLVSGDKIVLQTPVASPLQLLTLTQFWHSRGLLSAQMPYAFALKCKLIFNSIF